MGENPSIANGHDTWNRSRSRLSSSTSKQFAVEIFIQEDEGNLSPCLKYLYNVVSTTRGYEKILRKQVWRFVVIQHKRLSASNIICAVSVFLPPQTDYRNAVVFSLWVTSSSRRETILHSLELPSSIHRISILKTEWFLPLCRISCREWNSRGRSVGNWMNCLVLKTTTALV